MQEVILAQEAIAAVKLVDANEGTECAQSDAEAQDKEMTPVAKGGAMA